MSAATTIRAALRASDGDAVRALVRSSGFFTDEETAVAVELVDAALAHGEASGYLFCFAERGEAVVGYACFGPIAGTDGRWDLYWIVVDAALRGAGIGRLLLAHAEDDVRRRGGRRIYVDTSSREQYAPTRAFYTAAGYRVEALLADFYRAGDGKSVFLKVLTPDPKSRAYASGERRP